jgi:predicted SprT family Zn-dependent metalloprotease
MSLVNTLKVELADAQDRVRQLKDEIEYIQAHCPHDRARRERDDDYHRSRWIYICQDCNLVSTVQLNQTHS